MLTVALQELREACLFLSVADHEGLLRLPDPTGGVVLDGRLGAGRLSTRDARFKNVETHDVARGVVENESEKVEVHDGVETLGEVVEKRGEVALLGDGLANLEQGFKLTPGVFERRSGRHFRRRKDVFRHTRQDNTWGGGGSTAGGRIFHGKNWRLAALIVTGSAFRLTAYRSEP